MKETENRAKEEKQMDKPKRVCKHPSCKTVLSRYNKGRLCSVHEDIFPLCPLPQKAQKTHAVDLQEKKLVLPTCKICTLELRAGQKGEQCEQCKSSCAIVRADIKKLEKEYFRRRVGHVPKTEESFLSPGVIIDTVARAYGVDSSVVCSADKTRPSTLVSWVRRLAVYLILQDIGKPKGSQRDEHFDMISHLRKVTLGEVKEEIEKDPWIQRSVERIRNGYSHLIEEGATIP